MKEEDIKSSIYQVISILNINRMPTSREVRMTKILGLDPAISRNGGYKFWAEKLNLSLKSPRIKWTDEKIKEKIIHIVSELGLNRMPSNTELIKFEGNNALHNVIAKGYGYYKWAEILNLEIKDSETLLGVTYQNVCAEYLKNKGYVVENTPMGAPYDLLINANIKVDVKSGCAYDLKGNRVHTFGINKLYPTCDLYIIYALDEKAENIERTFIIPSRDLKLISLGVGCNSKYNKFIDRWDYIDTYDKFYKSIIS